MISPVTKDISGFSVHFRPLPATKAFTLAKRVGTLALPLIKSVDLSNLKAEIDLSKVLDGLVDTLANLSDSEAVNLVVDSLNGCTIVPPGQAAIDIQSYADVDTAFQGELEAMYEIVVESWKYNKLAPFKLAARFGLQTAKIATLSEAANIEKKSGPRLAM